MPSSDQKREKSRERSEDTMRMSNGPKLGPVEAVKIAARRISSSKEQDDE